MTWKQLIDTLTEKADINQEAFVMVGYNEYPLTGFTVNFARGHLCLMTGENTSIVIDKK